MSDEKRETVADIVASMRRGTKLPGYWKSCDLNKILAYHADRIEAAWKREREDIEADGIAKGINGHAEVCMKHGFYDNKPVGNAAAMREALTMVKKLFDGRIMWQPEIRKAHEAVNAALAAPARQCDVGTAEEQAERFVKHCQSFLNRDGIKSCVGCPCCGVVKYGKCELAWAQTTYEERGAGK